MNVRVPNVVPNARKQDLHLFPGPAEAVLACRPREKGQGPCTNAVDVIVHAPDSLFAFTFISSRQENLTWRMT